VVANLKSKCALVTGSTAGLGLVIARALAAAGCNVVLNNIVPRDEGEAIASALAREFGIDAIYRRADLSQLPQIEELVAIATGRFGAIDIVVNNAVIRHFAPIDQLKPAEWDLSLAVNLSAPFNIARLTLPTMRARGFGRIFNLSSYYGSRGAENRIGYVTTKTALVGMTRAIALEAGNGGADITCNAICPGTLPTPDILGRIEKLAATQNISESEATQQYLAGRRPAGRFVANESVADLIVFLCGPGGRDITGAVLPVDGGWTAT
jgi:3-hydroxybutyrate dehydrogenase